MIFKLPVLLSFLLGLIFVSGLGGWEFRHRAGVNTAYYFDDHKGIQSDKGSFVAPNYSPLSPNDNTAWNNSGPGWPESDPRTRKLGSGWGSVEIEAYYRLSAIAPFLQGEGLLTRDNTIEFDVKPMLSPVSFHVENRIKWTPLAFLVLEGGLLFGTGWPLSFMNVHGLALNNADNIVDTEIGGLVLIPHLQLTLQFDLAAILPGDYNHVVISLSANAKYMSNSSAGADDAWYWRADGGENFNGWYYIGTYVAGWRPPWNIDFIGFLVEQSAALSADIVKRSTIASGGWGSDFHKIKFGPVVNVKLDSGHSLTLLLQFQNGLYYSEHTAFYRWFEQREATGREYVKMQRLVLAYTWEF